MTRQKRLRGKLSFAPIARPSSFPSRATCLSPALALLAYSMLPKMPVEEAAHSSRSISTASDKYAGARLARTRARQM